MTPLPFIRWFFLFSSLCLASGCFSYRDLIPGRTELTRKSVVVPAQVVGSHFVVETKWDRQGPWRFLVDTGSSVTLVTPEFADRYATRSAAVSTPPVLVRASSGEAGLLPGGTVRRIDLGDAHFENVQVLVKDLGEISAHLGIKIDGILGFPLFRNAVLTLDYPNQRLVLTSPLRAEPSLGFTIRFNDARRIPLIPVTIGSVNVVALIDSGSDAPLILNPTGLSPVYAAEPRPGSVVETLIGSRSEEIGRLGESLRIGPYEFTEPLIDLTDELTSIGGEILKHFAVTFDQSRNQVTFHREDPAPIRMPPRRSTGLAFSKGPTYWRVVTVVPGSPADQLGIEVGDLVTRINGESISAWPFARLEPYVRRNNEVVFTFIDGSREKPVVVPTFDLVP